MGVTCTFSEEEEQGKEKKMFHLWQTQALC
jgi:hypothetical protein